MKCQFMWLLTQWTWQGLTITGRVKFRTARVMATSHSVMLLMSTILMRRLQRLHAGHRLSDNLRSPQLRHRSVRLWRRSYGPNSRRPNRADPDDTRDLGDVGLWRTAMFAVGPHTASDARFSIGCTWRCFQIPINPCTTSSSDNSWPLKPVAIFF